MNRKYMIYILTFLSLILCFFFIQESYAKYISSTRENTEITVARWKILVNNTDIRNGSTSGVSIVPVFPGNEHIASGIIAPTSEGYFDLIIDSSNADVSFKYTIKLSVSEDSSVKDLVAFKYNINDGDDIVLAKTTQVIEDTVLHSSNPGTIKIRVYVVWDDSESASMDNKADTDATMSGQSAKMNVDLSFIQVK